MRALFPGDTSYGTPKPERLIERIYKLLRIRATVFRLFSWLWHNRCRRHKMGRQYIGIEMGDHAMSHCAPRLRK